MPIYMKYGTIKGKVETEGYEHWTEIRSLQWSVDRTIGSAMGSSFDRQATHTGVSEITLTKEMDSASMHLIEDALGGKLDTEVDISLCTVGADKKLTEILRYTLTDTGLSHYSFATNGDRPSETFVLNFTKVEITFTTLNVNLNGVPSITTYDLAKMTLNG